MGSLPVSLYLFLAVCVAQLKCCICICIFFFLKYKIKRMFLRKRFKQTMPIVLHVNFAPRVYFISGD